MQPTPTMPGSTSPPSRPLQLIGVPTDVGASRLGAAMGPDALRVAGLAPALRRLGLRVHDLGNLAGPPNPQGARDANGLRHRDAALVWLQATHDAVQAALAAQTLPVVLGGDHSLAAGSISAVARHCRQQGQRLRVLWLDAHSDCNTGTSSPSGNLHGMPVAWLCGLGPPAFTQLSGTSPALTPADIAQVGLRSVDPQEQAMIARLQLPAFDMRQIDERGMRAVMAQALAGLQPGDHLHLSFDVDFLDPEIAPGTGTPVRGGPNYREAQLCMEMIADTGRLGSLDIVELNPALDLRNQTAELVVDLVQSLFGQSTLARP